MNVPQSLSALFVDSVAIVLRFTILGLHLWLVMHSGFLCSAVWGPTEICRARCRACLWGSPRELQPSLRSRSHPGQKMQESW